MTDTLVPVKPVRLIINGEAVDAASGKTFTTVNPATEAPICGIPFESFTKPAMLPESLVGVAENPAGAHSPSIAIRLTANFGLPVIIPLCAGKRVQAPITPVHILLYRKVGSGG